VSAIHVRLKEARQHRGESCEALARRAGVRVEALRAIEEGRFGDLPPGIYARAAIRSVAAAVDLDPHSALAECGPMLPAVDDPIDAMRRMRGQPPLVHRQSVARVTALHANTPLQSAQTLVAAIVAPEVSSWRTAAAALVDAMVIAMLLIGVITATVGIGVPMSALRHAAGPFVLLTVVLAGFYFLALGGIVGRTVGEYLAHADTPDIPSALDLHTVLAGAGRALLRDARMIERAGARIGHLTAGDWPWPTGRYQPDGPSHRQWP
jgi:hypothetical protein